MARFFINSFFLLTVFSLFSATALKAQITSPGANYFTKIANNTAYIFCAEKNKASIGTLTATAPMGVASTFTWEVFDTLSMAFTPFNGLPMNIPDSVQSTIFDLGDGLYRVTVNSGGNTIQYQAWILNNWIEITKAEIPDSSSNCEGFKLVGGYKSAPLRYFDPNSNTIKSLRNPTIPFTIKWYQESVSDPVGFDTIAYISPAIPSKNPVPFQLTVTDWFGCPSPSGEGSVDYISKVPKSEFSADPITGEAVLKVTFTDKSIQNYDSILWFFYKSDSIIKVEAKQNKGKLVDSIDFILIGKAPVYEYERTGKYKVKVETVKVNPTTGNCYSTYYLPDLIDVSSSLVEVPNVFTPNGDGANDEFVVKTQSLISFTIDIYNRWGGLVHTWSYSNIRSKDYTYQHSVWDGKIGGRMASPGVYFYVIRAVGRDNKSFKKTGFVHLFRNKN